MGAIARKKERSIQKQHSAALYQFYLCVSNRDTWSGVCLTKHSTKYVAACSICARSCCCKLRNPKKRKEGTTICRFLFLFMLLCHYPQVVRRLFCTIAMLPVCSSFCPLFQSFSSATLIISWIYFWMQRDETLLLTVVQKENKHFLKMLESSFCWKLQQKKKKQNFR